MHLYFTPSEGQQWQPWPDGIPQPKLMDLYAFRYARLDYVNWRGIVFFALMVSTKKRPSVPYAFRWDVRNGVTEGLLR